MTKPRSRILEKISIKLISTVLLLAILCSAIFFCGGVDSAIVRALPKYKNRYHYQNGEWFGGKMKYAEYTYEKIFADQIEETEHFTLVDYEMLTELKKYTEDFEKRVNEYLISGNSKNKEFAENCCFYTENMQ